jgi:hypothetical protein
VAVWLAWLASTAVTLAHHEPWADEAQAWLIARDLGLRRIWLRELRYEGTPGLWHTLLWLAQRLLHLPYSGMGVLGLLIAGAGAAWLLFRAPFPRPLRWLMLFSYFIVYQYAVVARSYVMMPLLAFAAAHFFKDRQRPVRMAVVLALLANVSLHGALIAAAIACAYSVQAVREWSGLPSRVRRNYLLSGAALLLVVLALVAVLWPPSDVSGMKQVRRAAPEMFASAWAGINGASFDSAPLTLGWLLILAVWAFTRRAKGLMPLALLLLLGGFYGLYGAPYHQGSILIATLAGLWIAWPEADEQPSPVLPWMQHVMTAVLCCLMGYQAVNAAFCIRNDYLYPYCGAQETAQYLKSVGAEKHRIMGYGYSMVAVQAFFDRNMQVNRPTAYFHHNDYFSQPAEDAMAELKNYQPDYVVIPCIDDCERMLPQVFAPFMRAAGFSPVHFADGWMFYKRGFALREAYLVYHRNPVTAPSVGASPAR